MAKSQKGGLKNYFKAPIKQKAIEQVTITGPDGVSRDAIRFEGYASTSMKDRTGDIVEPSAFESMLSRYMENPIVLLQHDDNKPIGYIEEATIDNEGLFVRGVVTVDRDMIFTAMSTGVIRTMSIGFKINEFETREDVEGFVVTDLELFEISLVSVPANPGAQIRSFKDACEKKLSSDEMKESFQTNKQDIYTFEKSVMDAIKKSEDSVNESEVKTDEVKTEEVKTEEAVVTTEENAETVEKQISETVEVEEKQNEKITGEDEEEKQIDDEEEKQVGDDEDEDKEKSANEKVEKQLSSENSLNSMLKEAIENSLGIDGDGDQRVYIVEIFANQVIYNHYSFGSDPFDRYYSVTYNTTDGVITIGSPIEVEMSNEWVEVMKAHREEMLVKSSEQAAEKESGDAEVNETVETKDISDSENEEGVEEVAEVDAKALKLINNVEKSVADMKKDHANEIETLKKAHKNEIETYEKKFKGFENDLQDFANMFKSMGEVVESIFEDTQNIKKGLKRAEIKNSYSIKLEEKSSTGSDRVKQIASKNTIRSKV